MKRLCLLFALAVVPSGLRAEPGPGAAIVLQAPWGDGPGALGRTRPREANPECPMSLAVDAFGTLHVLDQVNFRVQSFFDGAPVGEFALPGGTFQDIAIDPQGRFVLLDRLVARVAVYFDAQGRPLRQIPIEGPGIEFAGGVTGLFPGDDGLWLEFNNGPQVRVATPDLKPDPERPVRLGRPMPDGRLLLAAIEPGRGRIELAAQPPGVAPQRLVSLPFPLPVFRIDGLEADARGRILLAVDLLETSAREPDVILRELAPVLILGPDGRELRRVWLPPLDAPEEQLRPVRLGADGALYQLRCEERAAVVRRIAP